jgi:hypothetical protein
MVAGVYLSVSARASTIGREIQGMYYDMDILGRDIENLETQLAVLLSSTEMEKRALGLGFRQVTPEETFYVVIPGYVKPDQVSLADSPGRIVPSVSTISEEYTQSLLDWLRERVFEPGALLSQEGRP